jgi:uncharacterized protein
VRTDPTFLGIVTETDGVSATVVILRSLTAGQIDVLGSKIRPARPQEFVVIRADGGNLLATATSARADAPEDLLFSSSPAGRIWLKVQVLGSFVADMSFLRGLQWRPAVGDEVHVACRPELAAAFGIHGDDCLTVGTFAGDATIPARVSLDRLLTRHGAIVGSTGSGKTNSVAALMKAIRDSHLPGARVIIIDPHGEYSSAFKNGSKVFAIGAPSKPLEIPYWALSYAELKSILTGRGPGDAQADVKLRELICDEKHKIQNETAIKGPSKTAKRGVSSTASADRDQITADTPIPFCLRTVWYRLDCHDRATYRDSNHLEEAQTKAGDPARLASAQFDPYQLGCKAPFKGPYYGRFRAELDRMRARLLDPRFAFLLSEHRYNLHERNLAELLDDWFGEGEPIRIFDLSAAPASVLDVVVGAIVRLAVESTMWGRDLPGMGCDRPMLFVFEEAHRYLSSSREDEGLRGFALNAVRRLMKEGRKYGLGSLVVTQRPSEIDSTIMSQCGTFFAHRLTNPSDQSAVKQLLPDGFGAAFADLPSLLTGQAYVVGQAVDLPVCVNFPLVQPRPHSGDPKVAEQWGKSRPSTKSFQEVVRRWIQLAKS